MNNRKILSILKMSIIVFIAIVSISQPSMAKDTTFNRDINLNLYAFNDNSNNLELANSDKVNLELFTYNYQSNPIGNLIIRCGTNRLCKNYFLQLIGDIFQNLWWLIIPGGILLFIIGISVEK
ncbi:hypothetical protein CLI64_04500 [Nostoc sp. CENA543]|uniref:hypothetical protein n=1 Tax=Nostoc sp. CENA543 TaxID=1869241 RepID=UPI000CA1ED4E|nr:hypothetical protein [Nostoc sp. CENA543]AUS99709.1 hypothetical protein CLI64_04500 [Nostoc sp. CENA543]